MALHTSLRPIDLARATGISVQQVRNYESCGLLHPVQLCAPLTSALHLPL